MITLTQLMAEPAKIERLAIQSHDMCMYLVEVTLAGGTYVLTGDNDRPLVFRSLEHIKQQLAGLKVASAVLVQHSPYQEMIGLADDPVPPMEIAIVWPC